MKIDDLTPRQREVVEATDPVVIVFGGPGTGKTTAALWAGRIALERPDVRTEQRVLFLTFSRTAVSQIGRRSPDVYGAAGGRIEVLTFHSFAWRLVWAFGRYGGHGVQLPQLESESRIKLLGRARGRLGYDDLIPAARRLLQSKRLLHLVQSRWPLIICDEFQDTNDEQWKLLTLLSGGGRLLLLADPNQMIYTFLKHAGVGPERLDEARQLADREIYLELRSHRDPSGAIPAMADAVRQRRFGDEAVLHAVRTGRLAVVTNVGEGVLANVIAAHVARVRQAGAASIGIFGHSNQGVAELGAALVEAGIDHVLVGIPEAHGEALAAIASMCGFVAGTATWNEVRVQLATFLTACTRGKPPDLAVQLASGAGLPRLFAPRLAGLEQALLGLRGAVLGDVLAVAANAWAALGVTRGLRPWRRASLDFVALARRHLAQPLTDAAIASLVAAATRRRARSLVDFEPGQTGPVQLMNFHQTKGREADAVLLVYRDGDYLADRNDREPFEESSRVLFVSLTRARDSVTAILPPEPHALVAPFRQLAGHARDEH